ncbi:hypothetical protein BJX62DRAFT_198254 [Aspergillus germanicus]
MRRAEQRAASFHRQSFLLLLIRGCRLRSACDAILRVCCENHYSSQRGQTTWIAMQIRSGDEGIAKDGRCKCVASFLSLPRSLSSSSLLWE